MEDIFNKSVGKAVEAARENRGWNRTELSTRMNRAGWKSYRPMTVTRTERGERAVRLDEALALASVLGIAATDLYQSAGDSGAALTAKTQGLSEAYENAVSSVRRLIAAHDELQKEYDKTEAGLQKGNALYSLTHKNITNAVSEALLPSQDELAQENPDDVFKTGKYKFAKVIGDTRMRNLLRDIYHEGERFKDDMDAFQSSTTVQ